MSGEPTKPPAAILLTIAAHDCKCQDLDPALRGDPDDEHLECAACGMNYHSGAEYLEAGDPCPACNPPDAVHPVDAAMHQLRGQLGAGAEEAALQRANIEHRLRRKGLL